MAKPSDPRPPAIPSPAPEPSLDDSWQEVSAEEFQVAFSKASVIEDEAPPITHWDMVIDERFSAGDRPSLPPTGSVPPLTRPSLAAIPAASPRGLDIPSDSLVDDEQGFHDSVSPVPGALPAPPPPSEEETAAVPDPMNPVDPPDILARMLRVPSPESKARLPAVMDLRPPEPELATGSLEPREMALADAEAISKGPSTNSPSEWLPPAVQVKGVDTQPVRRRRSPRKIDVRETAPATPETPASNLGEPPAKRRQPAVVFAEFPPRTGPAIAFAIEPEPEPAGFGGATSEEPLQDRVNQVVGRTVDLVIEPPAIEPTEDGPLPLPPRYRWLSTLGEGGQGRVELVFDRDLGRQVALKTLHPSKDEKRHLLEFYAEARITGQLGHPNIMPVYDAGQLPDGRLYYTMRRMPGENLHNVLARLRRGDPNALRSWSLAELVRVLREACMGVGYAHDLDVLHRDLKPANILLGGHGEVLVVDWGIARFTPRGEDGVGVTDSIRRRLWSESRDARRERVRGSPPYMAPEQVKHPDQVGAAADVFCLGVILYEVLTRFPPFSGKDVEQVVEALCHEKPLPPRERAPELSVPAELEEICLRCLEKFPGHRYSSATELGEALGAWQSGAKRREASSRQVREADSMRSRYQVLVGRKRGAHSQLLEARGPVGRHRAQDTPGAELAMLHDRLDSLGRAADGVFGEAVWALHKALAEDPENGAARSQLAELYADRYAEAEREGNSRDIAYYRALLRQFDEGRWDRWLRGGAELRIDLQPMTKDVELRRIEERGGRLVLGEVVEPRAELSWNLAPGRYAAVLVGDEPPTWHYPLSVRRNQRLRIRLDVRGEEHAGERFCFIPGGHALLGGDPVAPGSTPEREIDLPAFAIARHPVSVGAYSRFLGWLQREDVAEARARTPQDWAGQARRGESRPVTGLSLSDARRYCKWLTDLTGVTLRLPSSEEWEKAVRGTDGRAWPWGDRFHPSATASLHACEPGEPLPVPGSFPLERSPFGVEDGAGLVWEWTETADERMQIVRGGSVLDAEDGTRVSGRRSLRPNRRLPTLGFRVVRELGD